MKHVIAKINENDALKKLVSVPDAIIWAVSPVSFIKLATVRQCFLKSGFPSKINVEEDQLEEIIFKPHFEGLNLLVQTLCSESIAEEFLALDDDLQTNFSLWDSYYSRFNYAWVAPGQTIEILILILYWQNRLQGSIQNASYRYSFVHIWIFWVKKEQNDDDNDEDDDA